MRFKHRALENSATAREATALSTATAAATGEAAALSTATTASHATASHATATSASHTAATAATHPATVLLLSLLNLLHQVGEGIAALPSPASLAGLSTGAICARSAG